MTDTTENTPSLGLRQVFVDDLSLEVPNAPQVFLDQPEFKINITINPTFENLPVENHYLGRLRLTVTAQTEEEKPVYVVEVQQSGVFEISGFDEGQLHHILHVYCPIHLFPYAREAIGNLVSRTGFPPILLPQFDFERLYRDRLAQAEQEEQQEKVENPEKTA